MRYLNRSGCPDSASYFAVSAPRIYRRSALTLIAALATMLVSAFAANASQAPTPANTAVPSLGGTPLLGQALTCSTGTWSGNPSGFAYAWLRDGAPIVGQTGSSYVVQSADQGHSIACQVTAANSGGEYTIVGLPSGSYKVSFSTGFEGNANYLLQYYNDQPSHSAANPVPVTTPNLTSGIDAALHPGGVVSGRVTAAVGGAPLGNVLVCAVSPSIEQIGGCATTNAAGEYMLVGLVTGVYTIEFSPEGFFGMGAGNYLPQSRAGVSVTAPNVTTAIDVELQPGGVIDGRVTAEPGGPLSAGSPIANVLACASSSGIFGGCATTNSNGEYTIVGLPTGEYTVEFSTRSFFGEGGGDYLSQSMSGQIVNAPNTTSVNAKLQPGAQIVGTVTDASTKATLAGIRVCAGSGSCTSTDGAGKYDLTGLSTGTYDLEFSSSSRVANYAPQSQPGISVTAPKTTGPVNAEMHPGGQIAGTVTDAVTHAPLANVTVCTASVPCASTNSAGQYTLSSLSTGSYTVRFLPAEGSNYLSQSQGGVSVTVGRTTEGIDAALVAGGELGGRVTDASSGLGVANIEVCASLVGGGAGGCATTNAAGGSANAMSNSLSVPAPNSTFKVLKRVFNAKRGEIDLSVQVFNPGLLQWKLFFNNADVGFTASASFARSQPAFAEVAKRKGKACAKGRVRHRGRCVAKLVLLAGGSQTVAGAGTVELWLYVPAKALRVLRGPGALHVSGTLSFQSAFGGAPSSQRQSFTVRGPKRRKKGKGKRH